MLGYKPDALRDKKKRGGRIDGPGTGTSDSIQKDVKDGTYIMPADSTEAIGEQALAGMGRDVPVNVSNGEYEMPPEQVHAVGVQALDQMKNATHEPVQKPQQGLGYDPELFFADGGVVDEEKRKKPNSFSQFAPQAQPQPQAPAPMAPTAPQQQQPIGITAQAMQATQKRMNDPIQQNAPQAPAPATLGSVANAGPGTANVGPFKVSHLPDYSQRGQQDGPGTLQQMMGSAYPGVDENGQTTGLFKRTRQNASMTAQDVAESIDRGDYAHAAGRGLAGGLATGLGYVSDVAHGTVIPASNAIASGVTDFFRGAFGGESGSVQRQAQAAQPAVAAQPAQPAVNPVNQQAAAQQSVAATPEEAVAQQADPAVQAAEPVADPAQPKVGPQQFAGMQNNVIRDGNSFYANGAIGQGYTVNGQQQGATNVVPSEQNAKAVKALLDRTPELGSGPAGYSAAAASAMPGQGQQGGTRFTVIPDSSRAERERQQFWKAATTAHKGAQNGQLTANQLNNIRGFMGDERTDATSRRNSDSTNSAAILRENMSQAGADRRDAGRRQDQAREFAASSARADRQFAADQAALGYQTRAADRLEKAYERFEAAETPEDRGAAAELIRTLSGKEQAPRFAVAAGGQGINADGTPYTLPAQVYNQQTGEFVNPQQQQLNAPQKGEVRNGYRFIGGDPASQKSWEKI